MSSEQPRRARESGGSGGSPIGSPAAIIIAVIAVVGGFLILRQITDDDDGGGGSSTTLPGISTGITEAPGDTSGITVAPGDTSGITVAPTGPTAPITPTTPPVTTSGATVVVVNASSVDGAAGRFTTALKGANFTTGAATNNTGADFPVSVVYYTGGDAAAQGVATYLSSLLGNIAVEPMPSPPPVEGGALDAGVTVLLMLGQDKADKTLAEAGAPATTTIPAPGVTTAPSTT